MVKYDPMPMQPKVIEAIKSAYDITDDEEAAQPRLVREFFHALSANIEVAKVDKQDIDIEMNNIKVNISILRPADSKDKVLPTILFLHGGGWTVGHYNTHGILSNELVNLTPCCVIFVNYSLSPEVKYPVALEECYAALCWVQKNAASIKVDPKRLAVAGDSAGGNLTAALLFYAKERGNTDISCQVLYYPVTDVNFESESYEQHKDDAFLPRISMEYMWKAYLDSADQHKIPTAVPMAAPTELVKGLPPTLLITADRDVLRSEGEAYGKKLIAAGVDTVTVRYLNVGHGFLTLPPLNNQAKAAISQTVDFLRKTWSSGSKL